MNHDHRSALLHRFYQQDPVDLDTKENRKRFGQFMRQWRLRNGWTQYTWGKYGDELGFSYISYGNLSVLEQGKSGELRWQGFWQIGRLNCSFFSREYSNKVFSDAGLRERLANKPPEPILHEDGLPWLASDFMLAFFGYIDFPWDVDEEEIHLQSSSSEKIFTEATALMYLARRGFTLSALPFCGGEMQLLKRKSPLRVKPEILLAINTLAKLGYSYEYIDAVTGNTHTVNTAFKS